MKSLFRTAAAVTAIALSSFTAQATVTSIALDGANLGKWVFFAIDASLAKDHSTSFIDQFGNLEQFTFGAPATGTRWRLDVVDLGAPGDMFNIYGNGVFKQTTDAVNAHVYADQAAANALAIADINAGGNNLGTTCLNLTWTSSARNQNLCGGEGEKNTKVNTYSGTNQDNIRFSTAEVITGNLYQHNTIAGAPSLKTIGAIKLSGKAFVTAVPEPSTFGMLFGGLAVVAAIARRRRNV
jgi:hypothetical protein